MATQVQRRRGTTAQHAAFSGQLAELTVDTDKLTVVVQDGSTLGGHPLAKEAALTAHTTDTTDAHAASAITNTPAGTITATTVQAAINELDGDIVAHVGDTVDAHDASAISIVDTGAYFTATDVEGALQELGASAGTGGGGSFSCRVTPVKAGWYYWPFIHIPAAFDTTALTAGWVWLVPYTPNADFTISEIIFNVTTLVSGAARVAIYASDANGLPGALSVSATIATVATGANSAVITSTKITAGTTVWIAFQQEQANTVNTDNGADSAYLPLTTSGFGSDFGLTTVSLGFAYTTTYAAGLPTDLTGLTLSTGSAVIYKIRAANPQL